MNEWERVREGWRLVSPETHCKDIDGLPVTILEKNNVYHVLVGNRDAAEEETIRVFLTHWLRVVVTLKYGTLVMPDLTLLSSIEHRARLMRATDLTRYREWGVTPQEQAELARWALDRVGPNGDVRLFDGKYYARINTYAGVQWDDDQTVNVEDRVTEARDAV